MIHRTTKDRNCDSAVVTRTTAAIKLKTHCGGNGSGVNRAIFKLHYRRQIYGCER